MHKIGGCTEGGGVMGTFIAGIILLAFFLISLYSCYMCIKHDSRKWAMIGFITLIILNSEILAGIIRGLME